MSNVVPFSRRQDPWALAAEDATDVEAPEPEVRYGAKTTEITVDLGKCISPKTKDSHGHNRKKTVELPDWLGDSLSRFYGEYRTNLPYISLNHMLIDFWNKGLQAWAEHIPNAEVEERFILEERQYQLAKARELDELRTQWVDDLRDTFTQLKTNMNIPALRTQVVAAREGLADLDPATVQYKDADQLIGQYEDLLGL